MTKTKYDYLNNNKKALSSDGKKAEIILLRGFNRSDVLISLGLKGYLRGQALADYEALTLTNEQKECRE